MTSSDVSLATTYLGLPLRNPLTTDKASGFAVKAL